jgi:preprotein translocase subunit SecE
MARDRQRAKQRQAERREARLRARRADGAARADGELDEKAGPLSGVTGAPPENTGRSDTVAESPPTAPDLDEEDELDDVDPELEADALEAGALAGDEAQVYEDELDGSDAAGATAVRTRGPRGVRGGGAEAAAPSRPLGGGSRVLNFLKACWAELQRVQWPDRRTLTQLTGIVLFFCMLAGLYLGAIDQVFSKLIQAIL